jgi:hypothetical protein
MKEKRTGEFLGSAFGNVVAIVFMNTVMLWRQYTHGVILPTWSDILWAANISLAVQIAGNLLLASYRPSWFYELIQTAFAAAGLLSVIVFFIVFPLDFSLIVGNWLNTLLKVLVIVGIGGTVLSLVIHFVRFIVAGARAEPRSER